MVRTHGRLSIAFQRNIRIVKFRGIVIAAIVVAVAALLTGCVAAVPAPNESGGDVAFGNGYLSDIANFELPTPEPVIVPDVTAVVNTTGSRANVRTGPGLDSPIVAKALPGDTLTVLSSSEDGQWWEVCCVQGPDDETGEATEKAWIAKEVVDLTGNEDAVQGVETIFPDDVSSTWRVDWECGSERCEVKECTANVSAASQSSPDQQWLQVEHSVTWDNGCFDDDSWVFEVDRYSAEERSGEFTDNFLYNYWLGRKPGPATHAFEMDDGRKIAVWCSGPHELELEEKSGWTTVYVGNTCHDVETGELVYVSYTKRWLFSGEYDGQKYERAYFGDFEVLEQRLLETNAELAVIE